jgi:hypothetical protein
MAEKGPGSTAEHCCQASAVQGETGAPDGIDPTVDRVNMATRGSSRYRSSGKSASLQLPSGDDAVLPIRNLGQHHPARQTFVSHIETKVCRGRVLPRPPEELALAQPAAAGVLETGRGVSSWSGRIAAIFSARCCCQVVRIIAATVRPKSIIAITLTSTGMPRWAAPKM